MIPRERCTRLSPAGIDPPCTHCAPHAPPPPYTHSRDAAEIAALLPRQLVEPVQWEGTVRKLVATGERAGRFPHPHNDRAGTRLSDAPLPLWHLRAHAGKNQLFELGPGQQIKAMVKRIDPAAWGAFKNVAA